MKLSNRIVLFSSALILMACVDDQLAKNQQIKTDETQTTVIEQRLPQDENKILKEQYTQNPISPTVIKPEPAKLAIRQEMVGAVKKEQYRQMPSVPVYEHVVYQQSVYQPTYQPVYQPTQDTEKYSHVDDNAVKQVLTAPVSTFSIDVDTAAYANVRRLLNQGVLPREDVVRIEELINYFNYDYPQPSKQPFSVYTEVGPSPWNEGKHLLHIGIQGKKIHRAERPASNLVFLIDVSGSMNSGNKLGLLKNALKMLSNQLDERDHVSIVVYAGAAGVVLEPTGGDRASEIIGALDRLAAGGSTNGGAGIQQAYQLAQQGFIKGGINRVILATDGDFNVGTVNQRALKKLIEEKRKSGVSLSVLGFGMGNYNDSLMQELAQNGDGNAYYIDTLNEARKVLVEELSATLLIIAKDVKIQIEFNPNIVSEYRLIGYETRALNREDFNNDKVDAGDIGAGHTVTAIYELAFTDSKNKVIDRLRYQSDIDEKTSSAKPMLDNELAFLRLRYKQADADSSQLIEIPIQVAAVKKRLADTSDNYRFSAAVAAFGQLLRGGKYTSTMSLDDIMQLAQQAKGKDNNGYRGEFIHIVKLAAALQPRIVND